MRAPRSDAGEQAERQQREQEERRPVAVPAALRRVGADARASVVPTVISMTLVKAPTSSSSAPGEPGDRQHGAQGQNARRARPVGREPFAIIAVCPVLSAAHARALHGIALCASMETSST